jgi:hypothetical protein
MSTLEMVPTYRLPREPVEEGMDDALMMDEFMRRDLRMVLRWSPETRITDDGRFVRGDDTLDALGEGLHRGKRALVSLADGGAIVVDQLRCARAYLAWMREVYVADLKASGAPAGDDDLTRLMIQESCQQAIADVRAVTDWLDA